MATGTNLSAAGVAPRLPPILDLPLDLFLPIVELLTIPELRLLGRANRGLRSFVTNHLSDTCYKSAIFRLPKDVLKRIGTYLSPDLGRYAIVPTPSSFARTCQKFYPTLMEHTVQLAIERRSNIFLYQAVKYNDLRLAPKILRLGGDVQGKDAGCGRLDIFWGTPLEFAAQHGHQAMVHLLLDAGAGKGQGNAGSALIVAILHGFEDIALLLWSEHILHDAECPFSSGLDWLDHCSRSLETGLLSLACQEGLVALSRTILQRHDILQSSEERVEIRTYLLLDILHRNTHWDGDNVDRPLPKNVHSVMELLLRYGAEPDMDFCKSNLYNLGWQKSGVDMPSGTIRKWASKSPDYRVRGVLPKIESMHIEESDHDTKVKSRRQATSNQPVHHQRKACKRREKHRHHILQG